MKCLMLALNLRLLLSALCGAVRRQWEIGWGVQESWLGCLGVLNTGWEERSRERMRLPNKSGREKVKDRPEKGSPGNWKARGIRKKIGDGSMETKGRDCFKEEGKVNRSRLLLRKWDLAMRTSSVTLMA